MTRGKILNRERAAQLRDFSALQFGNVTPTDVDAYLEFANKHFIFVEVKKQGVPFKGGQALALSRLVDALEDAGKHSLLIVGEHDCALGTDIPTGEARVSTFRTGKQWFVPPIDLTVRHVIDLFLSEKA